MTTERAPGADPRHDSGDTGNDTGGDAAPPAHQKLARHDLGRRRFLGYVLGGATLVAGADLALGGVTSPAAAEIPSGPQPAEVYDLLDFLNDSTRPTANLIKVEVDEDGKANFDLHRMEVGQGITTAAAMLIAEELDVPVSDVNVGLAPARPELVFNQLTGGSQTMFTVFAPIRVAAATARLALLDAAAILLDDEVANLESKEGAVTGPTGAISYADIVKQTASFPEITREIELKGSEEYNVIGKPHDRIDARAAVTGQKDFATDLQIEGALPTMVARAPTLNGTLAGLKNRKQVLRMDGVEDVAEMEFGVAIRARTYGQCIDAIRTVDAAWNDGPVAGQSDEDIAAELRAAELPLTLPDGAPQIPLLAKTLTRDILFYFRSNSAMDTNSAVADVREDSARIWSGMKSPITAQQRIAVELGMSPSQVECNVVTGGGSFGRRLFFDGAREAALISQKMGKPVKLMWHRADDSRAGRGHPMCTSRAQANVVAGEVASFVQQHTSVETDFRHGLGEIITANAADIPGGVGNLGFAQTVFQLTQDLGYNVGAVAQNLTEVDLRFNTGSMRNIYSPDVRCTAELLVNDLAEEVGMDAFNFRRNLIKDERVVGVLEAVAEAGQWGRSLPDGVAQGIAIHKEYKGGTAALVEVDARPETVNRKIRKAVTGPRVTKVTFAIDVGQVVNPRGLEAQMQGGINDGIALAFTSSLHLRDGHFLEASWDNYFYTRQWNTPPEVNVILVDGGADVPGGAGEAGVAATFAAVAGAWEKASGQRAEYFPINHQELSFKPKPFDPPVPQSPKNGLKFTF